MDDTVDTELYTGPELAEAPARSRAVWPAACGPRASLPPALRPSPQEWRFRRCRYRGIEADSGQPLAVDFVGVGRNTAYFIGHLFGTAATAGAVEGPADIRVVDYPLPLPRSRGLLSIATPAWATQAVDLGPSWPDYLGRLGRKRLKELRRLLRKRRVSAALSAGDRALDDFYHRLYVPFATTRFADTAAVLPHAAFMRRFAGAAVLTMRSGGDALAANLLTRTGADTLVVAKTGFDDAAADEPGTADLLDYVSLLLARVLHCRRVDLGASHAHLDDGTLRYKAKWHAELQAQPRLKRSARIDVLRDTEACRGFLRRNRFIQTGPDGFFVRTLRHTAAFSDADRRLAARLKLLACVAGEPRPTNPLAADYYTSPPLSGGD
ncbi:MAG: hypothetical protein AAFX58_00625 [Pseudomonadota bacterium]